MNKQVIKMGGMVWLAFIVLVGGFAFALNAQSTNQNTNTRGSNQNSSANRNGNMNSGQRNSNTGDDSAGQNGNMNSGGNTNSGNMNSGGNMNTGENMSAGGNANMGGTSGGARLSSADRNFFMQAAMSGMKEVELSRLAVTRASSDALRQFAQQMVDDHTRTNAELMQLASSKGVSLPAAPDAKLQAMLTRMGALSGAGFDRAYHKEAGVNEHQKAVKLFERTSTRAQDADVRAFAARTLPALRMHLSMAQSMSGAHGGGANHNGSMHGNTNSGGNMNSGGSNGNANRSGGNTNNSNR